MGIFHRTLRGDVHERRGKNYWVARRTYAVVNAAARALENTLWNSRHPAYTGRYAPRCRRIVRQTNWLPGVTKLIAYYKTTREPGKAKLRIRLASRPEKAKKDIAGATIRGPITDVGPPGLNYARVVEGDGVIYPASALIILQTAYERTQFSARDIAETMALVGMVNKERLRNFGDFPPETLLLLGAPSTHVWDEDELWYVDYTFAYDPKGWNKRTKYQQFVKLPQPVPVLTADGQLAGSERTVLVEWPAIVRRAGDAWKLVKTTPQTAELYEAASFRKLDAMLEW